MCDNFKINYKYIMLTALIILVISITLHAFGHINPHKPHKKKKGLTNNKDLMEIFSVV